MHTFIHNELLLPINHDYVPHEAHARNGMVQQAIDPWVN